jgi:hypothetical protein
LQVIFIEEKSTMKKLNISLVILALAAMVGHATTATSGIVGYSKITAPSGTVAIVPGFVKAAKFTGTATVTGQSFGVSGFSAGVLNPSAHSDGRPNYPTHYIEITSGTYEGYLFDILSNSGTSVTAANVPSAINGQEVSVVVRPHVTLDDIASTSMADYSDAVNLINPDGSTTTRYYAAGSWIAEDYSTGAGHTVIYPGQAVLLSSAGVTITTIGDVKTTKTAVPLYAAAVNYVGPLSPGNDTSVNKLQIASSMVPYSDGFNQFASDGFMTTTGTYYSDGTDILDAGYSPLPSIATDSIEINTGFALSVQSDGYWIMPSPLDR